MISIKSQREIELMKEAGRIVALTLRVLGQAIKPGISTYDLDKIAEETIREQGAVPSFKGYRGYPGSICASVNNVVIHGIPDKKTILKNGDIISIDIGACYKGYHGDSARTFAVGEISEARKRLLKVTEEALFVGLAFAKPANRLSDISHAIEQHVLSNGYSVVKEFTGHGIGQHLHEDPSIPNFGKPGFGPLLKPGMTLAIEPMVNAGRAEVMILPDDWTTVTRDGSDSAHFEHTIVITDTGYEILTKEGE
jgi:methionyl aminopeptidase